MSIQLSALYHVEAVESNRGRVACNFCRVIEPLETLFHLGDPRTWILKRLRKRFQSVAKQFVLILVEERSQPLFAKSTETKQPT